MSPTEQDPALNLKHLSDASGFIVITIGGKAIMYRVQLLNFSRLQVVISFFLLFEDIECSYIDLAIYRMDINSCN